MNTHKTIHLALPMHQRGMATLVFSLVILFTLTLTTFFGARVGLLNEKMSSNDYRGKEAMMTAEAGMDIATQNISDNIQVICGADETCANGESYTLTGKTSGSASIVTSYRVYAEVRQEDPIIIELIATGCVGTSQCSTADTTDVELTNVTGMEASAVLSQKMTRFVTDGDAGSAPMVAASSISSAGQWSIVGNPNGATGNTCTTLDGTEVKCNGMVSIWSDQTIDPMSGSSATCAMDDFLMSKGHTDDVYYPGHDNCTTQECLENEVVLCSTALYGSGSAPDCYCWNGPSGKGSVGPYAVADDLLGYDIVAPPVVDTPVTNFPTDLFAYTFQGIPKTDWASVKEMANDRGTLITNCASLNASSSGLWWYAGSGKCDLPNVVGTVNGPIMLVVDGQETNSSGNTEGFGLIYVFDHTGGNGGSFKSTGGYWYGGVVVDSTVGVSAGAFHLIYSKGIFSNLVKIPVAETTAVVPGSRRDWWNP